MQAVGVREERVRLARGARAPGAPDAVDVVLEVVNRELVVDDALCDGPTPALRSWSHAHTVSMGAVSVTPTLRHDVASGLWIRPYWRILYG